MITTSLKINLMDSHLIPSLLPSHLSYSNFYFNKKNSVAFLYDFNTIPNFASFDRDGIDLMDQSCIFADNNTNIKWISSAVTQNNGSFLEANEPKFFINNITALLEYGFTIYFNPLDEIDFLMEFDYLNGNSLVIDNYSQDCVIDKKTSPIFIPPDILNHGYISRIVFCVKKIHNVSYGSFNLYGIQGGKMDTIRSWTGELTCYHDISIPPCDIPIGTLDATVFFDNRLDIGQEIFVETSGTNYTHFYGWGHKENKLIDFNEIVNEESFNISYSNVYIITEIEDVNSASNLMRIHCEDLLTILDKQYYSSQSSTLKASPHNIEKITGIPIDFDDSLETNSDDQIRIGTYLFNFTPNKTTCRQWLASYCTIFGSTFTTFNTYYGIKEIKFIPQSYYGERPYKIIYAHNQLTEPSVIKNEHYHGVSCSDIKFYNDGQSLLFERSYYGLEIGDETAAYNLGNYEIPAPMCSYMTVQELDDWIDDPAGYNENFYLHKLNMSVNHIGFNNMFFNGNDIHTTIIYNNEQLGDRVGIWIPNKHYYFHGYKNINNQGIVSVTGTITAIELHIGNIVTADLKIRVDKWFDF